MRRVSVLATIRDAYVFTFTHLGGVIGLIWVSMVMITIAQFFTFHRLYDDYINFLGQASNAAQMGPTLLMLIAYIVAALLLYAVMCVAAVQLALGARSAPVFAHFAFGPLEWRMFRAFAGFTGLMFLISLTADIVAGAATVMMRGGRPDTSEGVATLVTLGIGLVLSARFLLLPAIAVNESGPALRRAWALSAGNLLPLIGVLLGLFVPLFLVFAGVLEAAIRLQGIAPIAPGASLESQRLAAAQLIRQMLPVMCGLSFFVSPLVVGLVSGASVSVWRALKDEPALDIAV
jgi:hypothetical protein